MFPQYNRITNLLILCETQGTNQTMLGADMQHVQNNITFLTLIIEFGLSVNSFNIT